MRIWDSAALVRDLQVDRLSERQKFSYLLGGTAIAMVTGRGSLRAYLATPGSYVYALAALVITFGGMWLAFEANRRGDNKDFVTRFICLLVPLTIRWLVLYYAFYLALLLTTGATGYGSDFRELVEGYGAWYSLALVPVLYLWLSRDIALVANGHSAPHHPA